MRKAQTPQIGQENRGTTEVQRDRYTYQRKPRGNYKLAIEYFAERLRRIVNQATGEVRVGFEDVQWDEKRKNGFLGKRRVAERFDQLKALEGKHGLGNTMIDVRTMMRQALKGSIIVEWRKAE